MSENLFRPNNFDQFIGQKHITQQIAIMIESAKKREKPLDHILFSGPPGLGKTSLSMLIGKSLGEEIKFHFVSAPALEKKADLASVLVGLSPKDILFLDEIHHLPKQIEEVLYSAMEDFKMDIVLGQQTHNPKVMKIELSPFTLIGATTMAAKIARPLRDRFIAHFTLDYYNNEELSSIIHQYFSHQSIPVSKNGIDSIALCARGTPRIALKLCARIRDYFLVENYQELDQNNIRNILEKLGLHPNGLDFRDIKFLSALSKQNVNGPVGLNVLAMSLGEEKQTIEEVIEPFLISIGFLQRTPKGRILTQMAQHYIKENLALNF